MNGFLKLDAFASLFTIDWARYRLTRARVAAICALLAAISIGVAATQHAGARDNVFPAGTPVGGDYVAFYTAAKAALNGAAAEIYNADIFKEQLKAYGPTLKSYNLTWQYPPTYYLVIAPLAFTPFVFGYILWTGGTLALFFTVLRKAGLPWFFLGVIAAAPSTFHAIITGQNGFLTASLIALAALYPDKRPLLAGGAAALLTVKPQLGVLIPLAYAAGGCWRAFTAAAFGTLFLAAVTSGLFGLEIWHAFIEGGQAASSNLAAGVMPLYKMTTPFSWFVLLGVPVQIAIFAHSAIALSVAAIIIGIWRQCKDAQLRAAALITGVFFTAPYGFYYELIILALPLALIAQRAAQTGWLKGEQAFLALAFIAPMTLPGAFALPAFGSIGYGFLYILFVAAGVMRRILYETPTLTLTPKAFMPAKKTEKKAPAM